MNLSNARLIAAAPDMLTMLERVTAVAACIYNNGKQSDCIAEARALIATIKGE